ncbi:MAG: ABC transporter permease [Anaerolineales bacterium]|nr:ABC transporter permease [Anaerolineales bacterium]
MSLSGEPASTHSPAAGRPMVTYIRPTRGWSGIDLRELWRYRELIYFLVWRDVKVRYKQSLLGAGWAILQPFLTMVVFSIFFGRFLGVPTDGSPYPVFSYAALLPWQLVEAGVSKAGTSLVAGRNLVTKVYFPRIAIPMAPILAGLLDFLLAAVVFLGMIVYYQMRPGLAVLALPIFLLVTVMTTVGVSLWLAALNVSYRDVAFVIPFLVRVWFFVTPITYPVSVVPVAYQPLYWMNPMVGVVEGFRWSLYAAADGSVFPWGLMAISAAVALGLMVTGTAFFRRMERTFADLV